MITKEFETMLYAFGCAARGKIYDVPEDVDFDKVLKIAGEQSIWQTVYLALQNDKRAEKYKTHFLMSYQKNLLRIRFVLETIDKMEKEGISCCLMKGVTVSRLYKEPLCRISGDTDILIKEKNEPHAMKVLELLGYEVEERGENSHHFLARHSIGGLLEVHVKMYSDPTKDILFENKLKYEEEYETININEHQIKTFSITDNAIYLTAHYIKHFISKGVGVRQLMDTLLYLEAYKDKINWERYNALFNELNYTKLLNSLYAIGNKYFGFSFATEDFEMVNEILEDTQKGGTFGYNNENSKEFYEFFTLHRTTMNDSDYRKYMYKKRRTSLLRRFFPTKAFMKKGKYHFDNNFELIIRYIQRLWDMFIVYCSEKRNFKLEFSYEINDNVSESSKKRLELMKKLEII